MVIGKTLNAKQKPDVVGFLKKTELDGPKVAKTCLVLLPQQACTPHRFQKPVRCRTCHHLKCRGSFETNLKFSIANCSLLIVH